MNKKNEDAEMEKRGFDSWFKKNKELVLRLLVAILSVAILFLWISNLKNVWRPLSEATDGQDWQKLKAIINEPLGDKSAPTSSDTALTSKTENLPDNQQVEILPGEENKEEDKKEIDPLLKEVLEKTNKKVENLQAGVNCPEWINCMPSFDSSPRACQIPPECEGITEILY